MRGKSLAMVAAASCGVAACSSGAATGPSSANLTPASGKSSASSPTASSASAAPGSVTVVVGGDDIPQEEIIAAARKNAGGTGYDFNPMFAPVKSIISDGDVRICQMEGALTPTDTNLTHSIVHNGPHEFATAVKNAGYDGCSTANNHTFDAGLAGLKNTRAVMAAAGLKAAGPSPDGVQSGQPAWYEAKGFKIAQLSYSYTLDNFAGGSETSFPKAAPWLQNNLFARIGAAGIEKDAAAARAAGADLVLVSMHWGTQFQFAATPAQVELAHQLLASPDVDYIIGNHAHVVQACEKVNGKFVNYGLGNQLSNQGTNWGFPIQTQDGVIVKVTFTRDADGKISQSMQYQPTWVDRLHGYVIHPVSKTSMPDSWQRTTNLITGQANSGIGNTCDPKPMS